MLDVDVVDVRAITELDVPEDVTRFYATRRASSLKKSPPKAERERAVVRVFSRTRPALRSRPTMWPRDPAVVFEPGTRVGWEVSRRASARAGGMGVVLAVRHADLEEVFALKLLHPAAASSPAARERFAREAGRPPHASRAHTSLA